ncbi:MAG TPA: carboxypeptidase regulatory-like domain-containing protein [Candidatus Acidoferrales bacterium]|nr:carboxypeptidase regulatory-like domain-containing protein [Candidatus Acidoferrales bacterium]
MQRSVIVLLAAVMAVLSASAQQTSTGRATIVGSVYVVNPSGEQSFVPGAKVKLSGPVSMQTESDKDGKYSFVAIPAGTYTLEAASPGLKVVQTVRVESSEVRVPLELKPIEVTSSVVVKSDEAESKDAAPSTTISEQTLRDAPNVNERFENSLPLVPGVVRGPDGRVNLKGTRSTQSGALVNSANVTDPVTGSPAINLPIDVVASVEVISNPYDPQYGKFTGAVSTIDTKTGDYEKVHYSIQNVVPRLRDRGGTIDGIGAFTPRTTFTGPIVKNRIAVTQSLEYRYVRTPVNSLPPFSRDTKLESVDSYTQFDFILNATQTATVSFALYPQKLDFLGLNTFTPQPATAYLHQRGYQIYAQHRWVIGEAGVLTSQFSYKTFDADVTAQSNDPYILQLETTEGGFFNRQSRESSRTSLQENYRFAPWQFAGTHQFTVGLSYEHSEYQGHQTFLPVEIDGVSDIPVERISFSAPTSYSTNQNETAWFAGDQWAIIPRMTLSLGVRFDNDAITNSTHTAPRAGVLLSLTKDGKTLLKGGVGLFYDRVPLMVPVFPDLSNRTVTLLDDGAPASSVSYENKIIGQIRNPRSTSWNLELDRQVLDGFWLRIAYEQRNTANDFIVSPVSTGNTGAFELSNRGSDSYREFQVAGRYKFRENLLNASYVRSRAFGDLNDFNQFFGNLAQAVIQPDARGRLPYDAPNRFLFWGTFAVPGKLTVSPVYDLHTGFPYSIENELREYVGPRNVDRFPRFSSFDLQISRPLLLRVRERRVHTRVGFAVFNVFNHDNPREVQNILASSRFGEFFNPAWREFRGKFVLEF